MITSNFSGSRSLLVCDELNRSIKVDFCEGEDMKTLCSQTNMDSEQMVNTKNSKYFQPRKKYRYHQISLSNEPTQSGKPLEEFVLSVVSTTKLRKSPAFVL